MERLVEGNAGISEIERRIAKRRSETLVTAE